ADWFQRPQAELERVVGAIERALAESDGEPDPLLHPRRPVPVAIETTEGIDVDEIGLVAADLKATLEGTPYEEASFRVPSRQYELHLVPPEAMVQIVCDIVAVEGPI